MRGEGSGGARRGRGRLESPGRGKRYKDDVSWAPG